MHERLGLVGQRRLLVLGRLGAARALDLPGLHIRVPSTIVFSALNVDMRRDRSAGLNGELVDIVTPLNDANLFRVVPRGLEDERLLAPSPLLSFSTLFVEDVGDLARDL